MEDEASASNSWVVSGEHTASGKPLVANDPHVPPTLPLPWQLQHLSWSGGTAVGISAPGLPGLAGGHNGRVAWAFTAAQIDGTDMALLERHPADPLRYRGGAGEPWREFAVRVDTVRVRFGDPVVDTLFTTPQGRVGVPPALARLRLVPDDTHMAELRDVSFDHPDGLALAALRMARANTTQEGLEAAVQGTFPTINFSVADTAGDIGYVTGARIALRPEAHARFVDAAPADDNERSYLPAAANPRVLNPSSGRIVTANQRIVGDTFPHYLSDAFAPPVRALRIHEALDRTPTHDVASFVAMQNDALSPVARELLPLMLVVEPATQADAALLEPLRGWDHTFASDATAPTIFTTWLFNLNRRLMADDLPGLVVFERWWATRRALSGEHPEWCDDRRTEAVETCGELLSASLSDAREALEAARGPDPQAWRFGDTFPTRLGHLGLGGLPGLGGLFSRTVAAPGGFASLFTASLHGPEAPGAVSTISHSSYQGVYDLADLPGGSRYIAPGGASGHFNSPFYDNLTERWAAGERVRLDPATRIEAFALRLFPN
jgi:penicillin amidase